MRFDPKSIHGTTLAQLSASEPHDLGELGFKRLRRLAKRVAKGVSRGVKTVAKAAARIAPIALPLVAGPVASVVGGLLTGRGSAQAPAPAPAAAPVPAWQNVVNTGLDIANAAANLIAANRAQPGGGGGGAPPAPAPVEPAFIAPPTEGRQGVRVRGGSSSPSSSSFQVTPTTLGIVAAVAVAGLLFLGGRGRR